MPVLCQWLWNVLLKPDFRKFDGIGVDGRNLIPFIFSKIPSDFSFPLPVTSHWILLYYPVQVKCNGCTTFRTQHDLYTRRFVYKS